MSERFSKFIQGTTENIRHLRETLHKLKEQARKDKEKLEDRLEEKPQKEKKQELLVHFSLISTAKATLVVIALIALSHFLEEIGRVILIFFISLLFSAALNPTVRSLEKRKIPRAISVIFIFLILIFILGFFISQLIPLVVTQLYELARSLTNLVNKVTSGNIDLPFAESLQESLNSLLSGIDKQALIDQLKNSLEGFAKQLDSFADNTFGAIKSIFSGVLNFFLVLILTFFMVVNEKDVRSFFVSLFPSRHGGYIVEKIQTIQEKIGYWLRGQVVLMCLMFTLSLIGLLILGIDNALTLAMMTGIAELLPVIGPIAAGVPAILVGFNESPWLAIWVLGLIILLQQIEGNILVPLVMRRAVGLSPIVIIPSMLIGLETLGVVGMIMAIPVATTLSIFVREYAEKEK